MTPQTFIFIGQSGCGKGTQAELLKKVIQEKHPDDEIFYLETGENFRKFIKGEKYSNKLAKIISDKGDLQPAFLAVYFWADILLNNLKGGEHVILDGICRRLEEAKVFTTAMEFYNRKLTIVFIDVSRKWSEERLMARGRLDDKNLEQLKGRLDWFEKDTGDVIEYFKSNSFYTFLDINGEQTIEEVHNEILQKLGW